MTYTDPVHEHGRGCWWDHRRGRWVCAPSPAAAAPPSEPAGPAADPVPAGR
jgi:hypothetical protein